MLILLGTAADLHAQAEELARAKELRRDGRLDSALTILDRLVAAGTADANIYAERGGVRMLLERKSEALEDLHRGLALDAACGHCYLWLSELSTNDGDLDLAFRYADSALLVSPTDISSWLHRGRMRSWLGRPGALDDFNRALAIDSTWVDVYLVRAEHYLTVNSVASARIDIRRALSLDSTRPEGHLMLAQIALDAGKPEDALGHVDRAEALGTASARLHHTRATALQALGRLDEAIVAYRAGLALDPTNARVWANLADAVYATEDMDGSCAAVAEGLKVAGGDTLVRSYLEARRAGFCDPATSAYYMQRGIARYNLEDYRGALEWYDKGLKRMPGDPMLTWTRGNARMVVQEWKGAADDYRTTLDHRDAFLAAWRAAMMTVREIPTDEQLDAMAVEAIASIRINRATALVNMKEIDEAMAEIDAGIDEAPLLSRSISALLTLRGRMHADARRYGDARKDFEQALRNTPDDIEARFMMATTLVVEGTEEPTTTISTTSVGVTRNGTIGATTPLAVDTSTSGGVDRAKLEEALRMYDGIIAAAPEFGSAYYQRGFVRLVLGLPGYCDDYRKSLALGEPLAVSGQMPEECRP